MALTDILKTAAIVMITMEHHTTIHHPTPPHSPAVLSDDDADSRTSVSPVSRGSSPAGHSRGSTPLGHTTTPHIFRPEAMRGDQIPHPPRSCSTPTPQGHSGHTLHLNNNNNNNDNILTDSGNHPKKSSHKNTTSSKSIPSKPSFMINDILSDKHPVKSRTPPSTTVTGTSSHERHLSSPPAPYPGDLTSSGSNTAAAAAALLGHQQRLSQLAAINSSRSRQSPPDNFDIRSQHLNGHHYPALEHHQQQLKYVLYICKI